MFFKYPPGGLLQLQGIINEAELHSPTMLNKNGETCLFVLQNGNATGATIGHTTGIKSFVQEYDHHPNGYTIHTTSMELAVHPYGKVDGPFSAPGDSGSVITDPSGHIVSIITGSTGVRDSVDVTYAMPYCWIQDCIKKAFPHSHFYPSSD